MTTATVLRFDIKLPRLGYSLNARVHWSERARVNRLLKEVAWSYAHEAFVRSRWNVIEWPRSDVKRYVQFDVVWPRNRKGPLSDTDNLGLKAVLDGIAMSADLLVDDSPKWCDYRKPTQEKGDHTGYVLVRAEVGPV